jgi:hypothetical protein
MGDYILRLAFLCVDPGLGLDPSGQFDMMATTAAETPISNYPSPVALAPAG